MSELGTITEKVVETEAAKWLLGKTIGKIESAFKAVADDTKEEGLLLRILPKTLEEKQQLFNKICNKYLTFRTILSENRDYFIADLYHPLSIRVSSNFEVIKIEDQKAIHTQKAFCIIGKAGQGKTTILRKLVLNSLSSGKEKLPLLISLRDFPWDRNTSIEEIVSAELASLNLNVDINETEKLLKLHKLELYFDGFDEVEKEYRKSALQVINESITKYSSYTIVTTRPSTEITYQSGTVENASLLDTTLNDVKAIISSLPYEFLSQTYRESLIQVVDYNSEIGELLVTPLLVDIFISTYGSISIEPKSLTDFYQELFISLISRHDRLKLLERKSRSNLKPKELEKIFCAASFNILNKLNNITLTEEQSTDIFAKACDYYSFEDHNYQSHTDIVERTSIIKIDGFNYTYLHKSILEFYAAKFISSLGDNPKIKFYQNVVKNYDPKFENMLSYLSEIDKAHFYINLVKPIVSNLLDLFSTEESLTEDVLLVAMSLGKINVFLDYNNREFKIKFESLTEPEAKLSILGQAVSSFTKPLRDLLPDDLASYSTPAGFYIHSFDEIENFVYHDIIRELKEGESYQFNLLNLLKYLNQEDYHQDTQNIYKFVEILEELLLEACEIEEIHTKQNSMAFMF